MSNLILKALKKERPIWLMRQAGRYLKEYQVIRKKQKNFIDFCLNYKAASKVTLQPIKRFDLDAAIIFSDILIIPYGLGQKVNFKHNEGPILGSYNLKEFKKNNKRKFLSKVKNVYKAIEYTRKKLNKKKSLIGFAGSPWTLLVYILNKKSPKKNFNLKKIIQNKKEVDSLLKIIEKFIYIHIEQQIKSGADTIQLFDSWAGLLNKKNLNKYCYQPNKRIVKKIKQKYPNIPIICFPKGLHKNIVQFCNIVKPDCLSIDSKADVNLINKKISSKTIIQGGLDPKFLLGNKKACEKKALFYLRKFKHRPYIFNLGHGVDKNTKPTAVQHLVKVVRKFPS